jgi:precorrin-6B methylase 2
MIATMSKKKGPGRPKTRPAGYVVVQARVPPELNAALESAAALGRRTKNAELIIALEERMQRLKLWAPTSPAEGQ